jgi:hypothetical protein
MRRLGGTANEKERGQETHGTSILGNVLVKSTSTDTACAVMLGWTGDGDGDAAGGAIVGKWYAMRCAVRCAVISSVIFKV